MTKDPLQHIVNAFIDKFCSKTEPLLLAFSGGPDSLALLYLLLEYQKQYPLSFGLAHVDHGWRPESQQEANLNAKLAKTFDLPFHLKTLHPENSKTGNLEAICREKRLNFFAELCGEFNYQGVMLAHQADDQAETVLKRIFEGASLPSLSGLKPESDWKGIKLWRPLLEVPKKELEQWLAARQLQGFCDQTNRDPRFFRGKCRTLLFPLLSKEFGKEIGNNLCHLGKEAAEFRSYLDQQVEPFLREIETNGIASLIDLTKASTASIEIKHLIRRFCEKCNFSISREGVEQAAEFVLKGSANKCIVAGSKKLYIDRGHLFIGLKEIPQLPAERKKIQHGETFSYGPWNISVHTEKRAARSTHWRALWRQGGELVLPYGEYHLAPPDIKSAYHGSTPLSKWWSDHKIPAFLREAVPVIMEGESVRHEFLTGKVKPVGECEKMLLVRITIN